MTTLVVGWSVGGLSVTNALRRRGHAGTISVLAAEPLPPYDRPPLSKKYLAGSLEPRGLVLRSPEQIASLDVQVQSGCTAVSLDLSNRVVVDDRGDEHRFERLIIATGARPRRLPGVGPEQAHYVRTSADADRLREALRPDVRLAVVGGGFLGFEIAATASQLCRSVTVIEQDPCPLRSRLGEHAASHVLGLHRAGGVECLSGVAITSVSSGADGTTLALDDGSAVMADIVVVAIGAVPNTDWIDDEALDVSDGVLCDASLRAADGVWAVGDVARWDRRRYGRTLRLEHRQNAVDQAAHVAEALCGGAGPFVGVPYFWTDQFESRIQVAGLVGDGTEPSDREPSGKGFVQPFLSDGDVVGVVAVDAPKAFAQARMQLS